MSRHLRLFIISLTVFIACGCACGFGCTSVQQKARNLPETRAEDDEIVIASTNDFHASVDRAEGLASIIRDLRGRYGEHFFYFDAGDLFQGSLEGNITKGRAVVDLMNRVGLDAAAIGNHDFDYGPDVAGRTIPKPGENPRGNLEARIKQAHYPWLSANIVRTGKNACTPQSKNMSAACKNTSFNALGQNTFTKPHAVFRRPGLQKTVCAIGATTPVTPDISLPDFMKGIKFEPIAKVVPPEAEWLRRHEGCDYIVLIAHIGLMCNARGRCLETGSIAEILPLLQAMPKGTVDAVIGGHSHLRGQETINGTPALESGSFGRYVGVMHLRGSSNARQIRFDPFIPVPEKAPSPAAVADVTAALAPLRANANEMKKRVVGTATGAFTESFIEENPAANLIADAFRHAGQTAVGAQFGLVNAGGVRMGFGAGPITFGDVFRTIPFDDSLVVVDIKGSELKRVLEIQLSGAHGVPGISGLRVKCIDHTKVPDSYLDNPTIARDLNGDGKRDIWERNLVLDVTDDQGTPIRDDRMYKLAFSDYLVMGGDHLSVVFNNVPSRRIHVFTGIMARDVVADYIRQNPTVAPDAFYSPQRPRVQFVSPDKP